MQGASPLQPGRGQEQAGAGLFHGRAAAACCSRLGRLPTTRHPPLLLPASTPQAMAGMKAGKGGIVANPNCSTIIALMAVTPLHRVGACLWWPVLAEGWACLALGCAA